MNTNLILKYLSDLSENNNREWYHVHKAENKGGEHRIRVLQGSAAV